MKFKKLVTATALLASLTTLAVSAPSVFAAEEQGTEVPTFENTKKSEMRLPYYYNSSTMSGRYGIYENKNDIIIPTFATSEGNYVTRGMVSYSKSYSLDIDGRKVYNFDKDGRQFKEETTDFSKKQYLGAIKKSDDVVYRYWK